MSYLRRKVIALIFLNLSIGLSSDKSNILHLPITVFWIEILTVKFRLQKCTDIKSKLATNFKKGKLYCERCFIQYFTMIISKIYSWQESSLNDLTLYQKRIYTSFM